MAKKSSKKGMNTLLDFVLLLIGGGIFGLLAMPFITGKVTILGSTVVSNFSGYELLDFDADAGLATIMLLFIIFASVLVVSSLLKLCYDAKIIKNKTLGKVGGFGVVVMALALLVLTIVAMIVVPNKCDSSVFASLTNTGANWLTLILFAVVSSGALVASFCSVKK